MKKYCLNSFLIFYLLSPLTIVAESLPFYNDEFNYSIKIPHNKITKWCIDDEWTESIGIKEKDIKHRSVVECLISVEEQKDKYISIENRIEEIKKYYEEGYKSKRIPNQVNGEPVVKLIELKRIKIQGIDAIKIVEEDIALVRNKKRGDKKRWSKGRNIQIEIDANNHLYFLYCELTDNEAENKIKEELLMSFKLYETKPHELDNSWESICH